MLDQPNQHNLQPGEPTELAPGQQPCGRSWGVIHTHPQAEQWACSNLHRSGYDTFLPMALVSRPDRVVAGLQRSVLRPLFPRYAFVVLDGAPWTPVRYASGVANLVMSGSKPGIVARGAVEALQTAQALAATTLPTPQLHAVGDAVVAGKGALRGQSGMIVEIEGNRAIVAMLMFGELRRVSCDVTSLSKM